MPKRHQTSVAHVHPPLPFFSGRLRAAVMAFDQRGTDITSASPVMRISLMEGHNQSLILQDGHVVGHMCNSFCPQDYEYLSVCALDSIPISFGGNCAISSPLRESTTIRSDPQLAQQANGQSYSQLDTLLAVISMRCYVESPPHFDVKAEDSDDKLRPSPSSSLPNILLTSDVWRRIPTDILGDIAAQLPTFEDIKPTSIVRHSETCRLWRAVLSPHIFRKVVLSTDLAKRVIFQEPQEETDDEYEKASGGRILRRFSQFLDDALPSGKSIVPYIKHLVISDGVRWRTDVYNPGWTDSATMRNNAERLVDVLKHFSRLQKLEVETLLPLDGFRIAEVTSQEPGGDSELASPGDGGRATPVFNPWTPIDVDEVEILFWDNPLSLSAFARHGIPRLLGLLTLLGNVNSLKVYGDMFTGSSYLFEPDHLPSPSHLCLSKLEFSGACSQPTIMRTLLSPTITAELRYLEFDGVHETRRDALRDILVQPALDPEHLAFTIYEAPALGSPALLNLAAKTSARLREVTLKLHLKPMTSGADERMVKCTFAILSTLSTPRALHSIRKVNIITYGHLELQPDVLDRKALDFMRLSQELDALLFDLYTGVHKIHTTIMPQRWGSFMPPDLAVSNRMLAELFPKMKNFVQMFEVSS
ncbi:hypothetical protein NM688_g9202 [Phlebia brevispora]|uniref:Uncharacterized protein n=1 Tax=Phlebia brevispora TaxID=194682 RepID=A0ACC1RIA7_9APHY|nr:hypothetical protein NM688_g9202 [Phlebia brevispora]